MCEAVVEGTVRRTIVRVAVKRGGRSIQLGFWVVGELFYGLKGRRYLENIAGYVRLCFEERES